jgi:hypothetical protein
MPSSTIADTRAAIRATPKWAGNFLQTLLGSRFFVAVSALFFVAFLAHVTVAQTRFPPISRASFTQIVRFSPQPDARPALPDEVAAQAREAAAAGQPYAQRFVGEQVAKVSAFYAANPQAVLYTNYVGLAVSGFFFMLALYLLARQGSLRRNM